MAASFNNEFGRPALCGYFRTFEQEIGGATWGYHKPIMIAGGMGTIREQHVEKLPLAARGPRGGARRSGDVDRAGWRSGIVGWQWPGPGRP